VFILILILIFRAKRIALRPRRNDFGLGLGLHCLACECQLAGDNSDNVVVQSSAFHLRALAVRVVCLKTFLVAANKLRRSFCRHDSDRTGPDYFLGTARVEGVVVRLVVFVRMDFLQSIDVPSCLVVILSAVPFICRTLLYYPNVLQVLGGHYRLCVEF
jgi:hypothetical protein